jgi:hypothetical protein
MVCVDSVAHTDYLYLCQDGMASHNQEETRTMAKTLHHVTARATSARKVWESNSSTATLQRMARLDRKLARTAHKLAIKSLRAEYDART